MYRCVIGHQELPTKVLFCSYYLLVLEQFAGVLQHYWWSTAAGEQKLRWFPDLFSMLFFLVSIPQSSGRYNFKEMHAITNIACRNLRGCSVNRFLFVFQALLCPLAMLIGFRPSLISELVLLRRLPETLMYSCGWTYLNGVSTYQ